MTYSLLLDIARVNRLLALKASRLKAATDIS